MNRIRKNSAFTLLELLTVIAIIGIMAAIALPILNTFKPNPLAAASRQLLDDLAFARHRAIADHSTVYVVFIPPVDNMPSSFFTGSPTSLTADDTQRFLKGQCVSYGFYERREIGAQPGVLAARYLTSRRTLPQGIAIPLQKFGVGVTPPQVYVWPAALPTDQTNYLTFEYSTNNIISFNPENLSVPGYGQAPFPIVAFDYRGTLVSPNNVVIPLTRATLSLPRSGTGDLAVQTPVFQENPPGGWASSFYHVVIDAPTGRAHVERLEVQ